MARKPKPKKSKRPLITYYVGGPEDAFRHHTHYTKISDALLLPAWPQQPPVLIDTLILPRDHIFIYRDRDLVAVYNWDDTYLRWRMEIGGQPQQFVHDLEYWARKIWGGL
jgi:hypothetical protein